MAMPPMQVSFHKKENNDSKNQVRKNNIAFVFFQTFRKDVQKGATDEGPGREADQTKKDLMQQIILYGQGKNAHQGYQADQKCTG